LKRAKDCLKGSLTLSLESSSSRMTHLAQQQIDFGRFHTLAEMLAQIDAVKRADIRRLAGEIFQSPLTMAALGNPNGDSLETMTLKV
jgi:predicted Zn-dependent peptidase